MKGEIMTLRINQGCNHIDESVWLRPYRKSFIEQLSVDGYAIATIQEYKRTIDSFCEEFENRGFSIDDLNGPSIEDIRQSVLNDKCKTARTFAKFCLKRFVDYIVDLGIVKLPKPPSRIPTAMDRLSEEYAAYLRHQCGMCESTIQHSIRFFERFMTFRFGENLGDLDTISVDDIVAFICKLKTPPWHLRNLFKFFFWSGKTPKNLANSIPRLARHKDSNIGG